jgi:molecular chaperone GrpE
MNEKKDGDFFDHPVMEQAEGEVHTTTPSPVDEEAQEIFPEKKEEKTGEKNDGKFDSDAAFGALGAKLDALNEQVRVLDAEFKSKIKYDQHKEKIIDDLHNEVQEYKNDLVKGLLRPVVVDIIHTIDDINKLVHNHRSKDPSQLDPLKLVKQMAGISSDLEDILFRQGVESFDCPRDEFDPKRQRIIKTEGISDLSKDKTISKRVHNGYEWEGKVLRQEMVNVFVYKPGLENPGRNKNEETNHE